MKNNWTKRLMACILSLALVLLALPAGIGGAFKASASAPSTADPYASVDEDVMIAGQNLGILGNENRLTEWEWDANTKLYVNQFTGNGMIQIRIAGTPFKITQNAQDTQKRFLGTGISTIFDHSITKINDDAYMFIESDGSRRYLLSANNWKDSYGNTLAFIDGGYRITSEGRVLEFDRNGKIMRLEQSFDMQPYFSGIVPITVDFHYDAGGTLIEVATNFYGNIEFKPTKEGGPIDAKDIVFERMPAGFGETFMWYYSGIMSFGEIQNTDGTGFRVDLGHPFGQLYNPGSSASLGARYDADNRATSVERRPSTGGDYTTWEFAYGDLQTTVTDPDGAKTTYYFDKWGNPTDAPDPGPDPAPAPTVPASEEASGLNLGVNTPSNLLSGWDLGSVVHANVNAFTGNLVFETKLPDAFSLYYNSQSTQENEFGKYFASEANRVIEKISETVYVLTEFDGSRHYFYERTPGSGTLTDKSGAVLNISGADTYTITSGGSTRQTFRKSDGRSNDVTVNADGNMSAYKTNRFTYFPATSSRGPRVQKILKNSTDAASFGYSTQGNIATTIRADGTTLLLTYDSTGSVITGVQNIMDGSRLAFAYITDGDGVRRLSSIQQFDASGTKLDEVTLSYGTDSDGNSQTTVTKADGTETVTSYDVWGNPIGDPGPGPSVPASEQAMGLNLGVNNLANMLEGWNLGDIIHANANAFSGNLVFEAKIPNAFSLYYNSQSAQENEFGKYFASAANTVLEKIDDKVYVLTEFDGSRHYFYERTPGSLTDEHGAVLDVSGSEMYVITAGSSTRLTYRKSDGRPTNVIVGADGTMSSYDSNTFTYYAATDTRGPRVQKIQKNGVDAASFGYNQNGNLTTTIRADGVTLLLTYDSTGSVITGVQNIMDGSRLAFAYVTDADGVRRVSSIQQYDASGAKLDEVTLAYGKDADGNSQTTVTKADGTETVTSYDEWGNPVAEPEPSVPAEQVAQGLNLGALNSANLVKSWNLTDGVTASVNAYNGNIVLQTGIPGVFPLVFNAQGEQQTEFGRDFTSAGNRRIDKVSDDVYVMTESDGSLHYFTYDKSPGRLQDERGISLYVRETYYELQNGASYTARFDKTTGRESSNTYNPDGTIASYGGNITFTYYAATDTRGPRVQNLLQNGASKITFGYRTDGNISTIILANGATLLFTYDSTGSTITGVQNIMDGSRITFSYAKDANGLQRANKVEQFNGSGAKIDEVTLSYTQGDNGNWTTKMVKVLEAVEITYLFDAYGNQI